MNIDCDVLPANKIKLVIKLRLRGCQRSNDTRTDVYCVLESHISFKCISWNGYYFHQHNSDKIIKANEDQDVCFVEALKRAFWNRSTKSHF